MLYLAGQILAYLVLTIYVVSLIYITLYSLMQFHLLYYYNRAKKNGPTTDDLSLTQQEWPLVTVQLPIFNERFVVARLIDNIMKLDYPKDKLEVQILDDSTDETVSIAASKVKQYRDDGFSIHHVRRPNRKGYKAGALKAGMVEANGEFLAIFDADFLPKPDFLRRTIPHFKDEEVGVVQTKWEHLNQDYSIITRLQAFQLNVHFSVEQSGRQSGNLMLQFNGTGGVWRKQTIEEAGGWEADTLTEDLDLSYRAQLKGWRIRYLENIGSPAELPIEMNGFKSQQFRWMKGGAETARKMIPAIWNSSLTWTQKLHATTHLMSSAIFLFIFLVGVFSVPTLFAFSILSISKHFLTYFIISLICIVVVYYVGNVYASWEKGNWLKTLFKFLILFPIFLSLSMGLSLHNSLAVIQGYLGKKSGFVRTPKFDIRSLHDKIKSNNYLVKKISLTVIGEVLLCLYFVFGLIAGWVLGDTSFLLFHLMLALGYGTISYITIKHLRMGS